MFFPFYSAYTACPERAEKEYTCPAPGPYKNEWRGFYESDTESAHISHLVHSGKKMVPYLCEAIKDKKMFLRRYAIGALGYLKDEKATPVLRQIFENTKELDYFRGDALESIYIIDQNMGRAIAIRVLSKKPQKDDSVKMISDFIVNHPERISLNWEMYYGP